VILLAEHGYFDSDVKERAQPRFPDSPQPMDSSQINPTYYAVKNGRDGSAIWTTWENVRAISIETNEFRPTDTPLPIAYSSNFRWDNGVDSTQYLIESISRNRRGVAPVRHLNHSAL
jgi:hypothetical protein